MFEILYGKNSCIEAIKKGREITEVLITNNNKELIPLFKEKKLNYKIVSKEELDSLVKNNTGSNQGIVCKVLSYEYSSLNDIMSDDNNSLIVMLDGFEDPHNLGAVIRTCEITKADGIIIPKNRSVRVNETVSKVSAGAIENVKICMETNLSQTIKTLKKNGYWICGAEALDESKSIWDMDFKMKTCLVIGSEGFGISRLVREECDFLVKIPMWGKVNSLNASVSAAVIMYEIRRQQNSK